MSPRFVRPLGACVIFLVAFLPAAAAQSRAPTAGFLVGLPRDVAHAVEHAAESARSAPGVVLARARAEAAQQSAGSAPPTWELAVGGSLPYAGGWSADTTLGVSVPVVDPSSVRRTSEAERTAAFASIEADLAARDAALGTLSTWLALWSARVRIHLLTRSGPRPDDPDLARWLDQQIADLPGLRLEAELLARRMADRGVEVSALDFDAWNAYVGLPTPMGCVDAAPDVRLAAATAHHDGAALEADRHASRLPTVAVHGSLGLAALPDFDPSAGPEIDVRATVRLDIGVPTAWPVVGSASVDLGERGLHARARVGSDVAPPANHADLAQAAAEERVRHARRAAEEGVLFDQHLLDTLRARLAAGRAASASGELAIDQALTRVGWIVRAVEARARLTVDCPRVDVAAM